MEWKEGMKNEEGNGRNSGRSTFENLHCRSSKWSEQHEYDLEQHAQPKPVAPAVQCRKLSKNQNRLLKPKHSKIRILSSPLE